MTVFHSGIHQRRFVGCKVDFGGYPKNCARKKKGRAILAQPSFFDGARGWSVRPDRNLYSAWLFRFGD